MLTPDRAFSICGGVAALSWLGLTASLFISANLRAPIWAGTACVVPFLVGLAYAVLLAQGLCARAGGGFGSIAAVRRLFANDAALAAGWLHYIAFRPVRGHLGRARRAQCGHVAAPNPVVSPADFPLWPGRPRRVPSSPLPCRPVAGTPAMNAGNRLSGHAPREGQCLPSIHTGRAQRSLVPFDHSTTQRPIAPEYRRKAPSAVRATEKG